MKFVRIVIEPSDYYEEWDVPVDDNTDIPSGLNDDELKAYVVENFHSLGAIMNDSGYQNAVISDDVEILETDY